MRRAWERKKIGILGKINNLYTWEHIEVKKKEHCIKQIISLVWPECQDVRLENYTVLCYLIFLKKSLVFPILLFSSIFLHWLLRKAFLSLLAILWNSAFTWEYLSFSPLHFTSLHFTAICKASSDNHFAFLHFFSMGMVLIPVFCTMSRTSIHSSSGSLSDLAP